MRLSRLLGRLRAIKNLKRQRSRPRDVYPLIMDVTPRPVRQHKPLQRFAYPNVSDNLEAFQSAYSAVAGGQFIELHTSQKGGQKNLYLFVHVSQVAHGLPLPPQPLPPYTIFFYRWEQLGYAPMRHRANHYDLGNKRVVFIKLREKRELQKLATAAGKENDSESDCIQIDGKDFHHLLQKLKPIHTPNSTSLLRRKKCQPMGLIRVAQPDLRVRVAEKERGL